jgi:signal transduction histidine kinase
VVFKHFYRVEGAVASGSGLGLSLAQQLAVLVDGSTEVDSTPGHTTFSLVLPLHLQANELGLQTQAVA